MSRFRKCFITVLITAIVVLCLAALYFWLTQPSIAGFQKDFGFSLNGIDVKIVDHYNEGAWQDNWSAYTCKISGATEGSMFDPTLMDEGLPPMIKRTFELNNADRAAKGFKPYFKEKTGAVYRSRILVENADPNPDHWTDRLFIIYSPSEELYYVFCESFVASN